MTLEELLLSFEFEDKKIEELGYKYKINKVIVSPILHSLADLSEVVSYIINIPFYVVTECFEIHKEYVENLVKEETTNENYKEYTHPEPEDEGSDRTVELLHLIFVPYVLSLNKRIKYRLSRKKTVESAFNQYILNRAPHFHCLDNHMSTEELERRMFGIVEEITKIDMSNYVNMRHSYWATYR